MARVRGTGCGAEITRGPQGAAPPRPVRDPPKPALGARARASHPARCGRAGPGGGVSTPKPVGVSKSPSQPSLPTFLDWKSPPIPP